MTRFLILCLLAACLVTPARAQPLGDAWGTAAAEAEYYRIVDLPIPEELAIETGSFEVVPDGRLAIGTRRGEIYLVSSAFDSRPRLRFHRFAAGLDEVFGLGYRDGAFYVTQQAEVTKITDTDGDDRADRFETLGDPWGFEHYHEFSWGSPPDPDGNVWIVLGLSASYHYKAKFRGWAFKITPAGESIPIASGVRSGGGVAPNEHGVMFYAESQGPWNGSCSLKHLKPGGFMGHPISFPAYEFAPNMSRPLKPKNRSRLHVEARRVKELVPYAVVFPYRKMGQSIAGFRVDRSGGKFVPFQDQIFIVDYGLSSVMRATTEKINGVWQGACYPFREGFRSGLIRVAWGEDGSLIAGMSNRGWGSKGNKGHGLQRLVWKGKTPFEIQEMQARPSGFRLQFTQPVDVAVAEQLSSYTMKSYTYELHSAYGSGEMDTKQLTISEVIVSADARSVELKVEGLRGSYVHELVAKGLRSAAGLALLHADAYYTLNEIPKE